jgi:hypothetical protein
MLPNQSNTSPPMPQSVKMTQSALVHKYGDGFFKKWIPAFAGMTLRPSCHSGESRNPEIV